MELRQRSEPIRSKTLRDSARGAPCMLNFPCCNHDPATSVWCHWHDESFGKSRKANDTSGFPGCSACHRFLDIEWSKTMELGLVRFYVIRALQRTFVWLLETGVLSLKLDAPAKHQARHRKPKEQRKAIPARKTEWASRPMQSRNDLKRAVVHSSEKVES